MAATKGLLGRTASGAWQCSARPSAAASNETTQVQSNGGITVFFSLEELFHLITTFSLRENTTIFVTMLLCVGTSGGMMCTP